MFILKLAVIVCANGFVITDETDDMADPFPVAGFGDGQLPQALDFLRTNIERDIAERAEATDAWEAQKAAQALGNVVAGPGFKAAPAPAAVITRLLKTDREIVDEVNELAVFMLSIQGSGYAAPAGTKFYRADPNDVRATRAWNQAAEAYQQITGSEVSDALQAVLEEEEALREEARKRMAADQAVMQPNA